MKKRAVNTKAVESYRRARRTADRVLDRTALRPAERVYEEEAGRLIFKLGKLLKGRTREPLSMATVNHALVWFHHGLHDMAVQLGGEFQRTTRLVQTEGVRATASVLSTVRGAASPLDDQRVFHRVLIGPTKLQTQRRNSARGFTADVHETLRKRLLAMPVEEAKVRDLISVAGETLSDESWRLERLVRTETSYAYNLAQSDAMVLVAQEPEFQGARSRWTEMVNDLTLEPFDGKVGQDSIALHGQVTRPGGVFTMPSSARVPHQFLGKSWSHPPNRPNDRAVLTPWMRGWGVPGWTFQGGSRVNL